MDERTKGVFDSGIIHRSFIENEPVSALFAMAKGNKILDIGALTESDIAMAREGKSVTVLCSRDEGASLLKARLGAETTQVRGNITLLDSDFLTCGFAEESFDTVIAANVLEHASFPEQWVKKAFGLLKEDGVFLACVPFGYDPRQEAKRTYFLFELLELVMPFGPVEDYGVHEARYAYVKVVKKTGYNGMLMDMRDVLGKSEKAFLQKEKQLYSAAGIKKAEHTTPPDNILQPEKDALDAANHTRQYSKWALRWQSIRQKPFRLFSMPFQKLFLLARGFRFLLRDYLQLHLRHTNHNFGRKDVRWPQLSAAVLGSRELFRSIALECKAVRLTTKNMQKMISKSAFDLLLVEGSLIKPEYFQTGAGYDQLCSLLAYCKENNIKTACLCRPGAGETGWQYMLFDDVLRDEEYNLLTRAVQTKIYSPARQGILKRKRKVCLLLFKAFTDEIQKKSFETLACAALPLGLHVYCSKKVLCEIPAAFHKSIQKIPKENRLISLYKKYPLFLHPYAGDKALLLLADRQRACGANVLALGEEKETIRSGLPAAGNGEEAAAYMQKILCDDDFAARQTLHGLRHVHEKHSFSRCLQKTCGRLGIARVRMEPPGISVVVATNRQSFIETVFQNFCAQDYAPKEMIVVLNKNDMDMALWQERAANSGENITILRCEEGVALGACLNTGFDRAKYGYLTKLDDDNYYAPRFLSDLMLYFDYTWADIVGKWTYYIYFEGLKTLALKNPGMEQKYHSALSGSAMIFKKKVFERVRFGDMLRVGEDTAFLKAAAKKGFRLYSADRFNYIVMRRPDVRSHTWQVGDEEHMAHCKIIGGINDYKGFVTV